jgi:threonine dehydratase
MGKNYDEAHVLGMEYIKNNSMTFIDAYYDDPKIYGGQGTVAIEILRQNPEIDVIVVPIGGGGLITGIAVAAKAIKPKIRIVGVQTEVCPAMIKAYEDNVFYEDYPCEDSLCDALIGGIGALSYAMAKDYVDDFIAVSEETIGKAVSFMAKEEKYIVEAGSCTTVAAVMDFSERIGGNNIALVMSGGNIDADVLLSLMNMY